MRQVEEREHAEAGEAQRQLPQLHGRAGSSRSGCPGPGAAWPLPAAVSAGRAGAGMALLGPLPSPSSAPRLGSLSDRGSSGAGLVCLFLVKMLVVLLHARAEIGRGSPQSSLVLLACAPTLSLIHFSFSFFPPCWIFLRIVRNI